jgi:cell division protease FtsH
LLSRKTDEEIKNILMESYEKARSIFNKRRGHIEKIARILLESETLEGGELEKLLQE